MLVLVHELGLDAPLLFLRHVPFLQVVDDSEMVVLFTCATCDNVPLDCVVLAVIFVVQGVRLALNVLFNSQV